MEIKRVASQASGKGSKDWFTGTVRIDSMFDRADPARASGAIVTFEPGARTAWHTHPLGQTLIVTSGCGWAQREGGLIEEIRPGDVVWFPPGLKHWQAAYDLPYLAHATMEPLNCVADVRLDSCEIWTGTQFQTVDRDAAAKETGLKPEQVKLHTMLCGGGFGRRAVPDSHFVVEAVQVSKAIQKPVKVVWTREDDMRGGFYRPRAYHTVSAGLDAKGQPLAWQQRIVCQSFIAGTPFAEHI